ncbi:hypothetical protein PMG11_08586 [Penicillium brasilianum]|uniref:Cysteine-rich secreted protein n=1 Tax=Penicillium brasilianum TaxID=104259 RepID=A0A0F7TTJ5_PENBI|nr:hypothetical protein PMG11_08586 [Penicillium brasilianum]
MRGLSLVGLTLLLRSYLAYAEKVAVKEIGDDFTIDGDHVTWPDGPFTGSLSCTGPDKVLSLSADKKYGTCCPPGASLKGSAKTEWHCCGQGHDVTGSKAVGFECCLEGSTFDGKTCKRANKCTNGKEMINGKCQCSDGKEEAADGTCKSAKCDSGIKTGKCYFFKGRSGNYLTFNANQYSETGLSKYIRPGKFQFCQDPTCIAGLPVNPSNEVQIKDLHGTLPAATDAGQWLDGKQNGGHIGKTPDYSKAGNFSITKWPCGKYCLTGFVEGITQACPDVSPGISMDTRATDSCIEFELLEVPCDLRDDANNCIWKNGDQCCDKIDCRGKTECERFTWLEGFVYATLFLVTLNSAKLFSLLQSDYLGWLNARFLFYFNAENIGRESGYPVQSSQSDEVSSKSLDKLPKTPDESSQHNEESSESHEESSQSFEELHEELSRSHDKSSTSMKESSKLHDESSESHGESSQSFEEIHEELSQSHDESSKLLEDSSKFVKKSAQIHEESSQLQEESSQPLDELTKTLDKSSQSHEESSQFLKESSQFLEDETSLLQSGSYSVNVISYQGYRSSP